MSHSVIIISCGDLFGGDLYEEEQAVELAKYLEQLAGSAQPEGDEVSPEVQEIAALVSRVVLLTSRTPRVVPCLADSRLSSFAEREGVLRSSPRLFPSKNYRGLREGHRGW